MHEWQKRKKNIKFTRSTPFLLFLILILVLGIKGTYNLYEKGREAASDKGRVVREMAEMQARKGFLESSLNNLHTVNGVDSQIRQKFNVKKSDEEVAVILKANNTPDGSIDSSGSNWLDRVISGVADIFR